MSSKPLVIDIWPDAASNTQSEVADIVPNNPMGTIPVPFVRNIVRPTLTIILPDPERATGTGIVVAPGGAFHILAFEHEGTQVAEWLVERGIAAFILHYRLITTSADDEEALREMAANLTEPERRETILKPAIEASIADGIQALRVARNNAAAWNVDPKRIGILGFSAGGVVATGAALRYDAESRPAFAAPIYTAPLDDIVPPADAPPLFMALTTDDTMAANASIPIYSAWRAAGRRVEMHIYSQGEHGFGMLTKNLPSDQWIEQFGAWLTAEGF